MPAENHTHAGQAVYTPRTLKLYDWFVLGFSNRFLWRCPTKHLAALYARNVTTNHLDVGVGTGYFLDRADWPASDPSITLLDLNQHSLEAAAARIGRYAPRTVAADILQPLPADSIGGPFDSAALCYLLHCLPGTIPQKAAAFDHLLPFLAADARVFGATIVQDEAPRSAPAQALMNFYNRKGIFSNADDTAADLRAALEARFVDVNLQRFGTVVTFEARTRT